MAKDWLQQYFDDADFAARDFREALERHRKLERFTNENIFPVERGEARQELQMAIYNLQDSLDRIIISIEGE